ncbi:MAG: RNA polymerase sigma factor [Bacteroidota bacterium]
MVFEEIFHTHKERVFSLCFRYLQQEQEAEDAVQDVFVKVFHNLDTFKAESQIGTWIYRIAINHCLDILKSRKRKQQILRFVAFFPFVSEKISHTELKLEDKEAYQNLQDKLQLLPEKQLTALLLNKLEGIPIEQVAQIMNLSYKAVESLLQRGKQNLQKHLNNTKE